MGVRRGSLVLNALLVTLFATFAYANLVRWHDTGRPVGLGAVLLEGFTAFLFLVRRPPQVTTARPVAWIAASLGAFAMLGARLSLTPTRGRS